MKVGFLATQGAGMTFDEWWDENQAQYSNDSLHMSEYHMASVVWAAAVAAEREACAVIADGRDTRESNPSSVIAMKIRERK